MPVCWRGAPIGLPRDYRSAVKYTVRDMLQIINIVGLIVVVCIAWALWTERKSKQALEKDALDQAWKEMPDDPYDAERRHYEERRQFVDQAGVSAGGR